MIARQLRLSEVQVGAAPRQSTLFGVFFVQIFKNCFLIACKNVASV